MSGAPLPLWRVDLPEDSSICAVVVTYRPDLETLSNLRRTRLEVDELVVVDNGTEGEPLNLLGQASREAGFTLIENGENLGIATALNCGVIWAKQSGYRWVLLLDQDSHLTPGFAATMLRGFRSSRWGERLAILVPRYIDRRFGTVLPQPQIVDGSIEQASTSGSLMPMSVFDRFGLFQDELFIDGVDSEYSLRVRAEGFKIEECVPAVLLHAPGSPTRHRLWWGKSYQASNQAPVRLYYQERNKLLMLRCYGRRFPGFFLRQFIVSWKNLFKVVLVETGKPQKLQHLLRGVLDGARGRTGKFPGQ